MSTITLDELIQEGESLKQSICYKAGEILEIWSNVSST